MQGDETAGWRANPETLDVLEWPQFRAHLVERAATPKGRRSLSQLSPSAQLDSERARLRASSTLDVVSLRNEFGFGLPLTEVPDVEPLFLRITRSASISVKDFSDICEFHKVVQSMAMFLAKHATGSVRRDLGRLLSGFHLCEDWARRHFPLLDPYGQIADSASEDLKALRALSRDLHAKIRARLEDALHNPKTAELLQDQYITVRDGRYVLPIKVNFRNKVPGIVHDVSNSEHTVFIEPEQVVEWNNQLKVVEKEIEKEIERILAEVVERTKPFIGRFDENLALLVEADILQAASSWVVSFRGDVSVAEWIDGGTEADISFVELRHPQMAIDREVISNGFEWSQGLILSGPNTGGKTVLLKSVGLAVIMAMCGLPVPAKRARFPKNLKGLWADIGDDQNLEKDLSTFSGHLLVLKRMVEGAGPGDLVLIDEIATGTSPEDGQPLAQAVLEELLSRGARLFVTTHYGNLKQFAMVDMRCRVASMAFDRKHGKPTYEIVLDVPGDSSAFEVAANLGLPMQILDRARALRGEVSGDLSQAVSRLEESRQKLTDLQTTYKENLLKVEAREKRAAELHAAWESKQRENLSEESRQVLRDLHQIRDELSKTVKAAGADLGKSATSLFQKISDASDQVRHQIQNALSTQPRAPLSEEDLQPETIVDVEGLGLGTIIEVAKSGVLVQVGEIKSRINKSRLYRPSKEDYERFTAARASRAASQSRKSNAASTARGPINGICDVRGKSSDEALRKVEVAINDLARSEGGVLTVIHGHGSDRLKDSIRSFLSKNDLRFRSGSWPGEGGDGVTIVEKT